MRSRTAMTVNGSQYHRHPQRAVDPISEIRNRTPTPQLTSSPRILSCKSL
jgi:hypothetical protein